jgi:hypothetical protein
MKAIDPKYHIDEERIVKTSNGSQIPEDEPLILFRARDRNALLMLKHYRELCVQDGCTPYHLEGIDNRIAAFEAFSKDHAGRMKQPGCTLGK